MKRKIKIFLFAILIVFSILLLSFRIYTEFNSIERYDDINLFIDDSYLKLNDYKDYNDTVYKGASKKSKYFFPDYSEFANIEIINGFYIFDGSKTIHRCSLSFVLDLKFDNLQDYENYLANELTRCNYTSQFNISYNNYECLITTDETYTYYHVNKKVPYEFGMLCYDKENFIIRYVYFRECGYEVDEKFDIVFKNTNCDW